MNPKVTILLPLILHEIMHKRRKLTLKHAKFVQVSGMNYLKLPTVSASQKFYQHTSEGHKLLCNAAVLHFICYTTQYDS